MRNVVIITNPAKLEILKSALDKIDITGMTVSYVSGCGIQKGSMTLYRSAEMDMHLLPKVKVEVVISTVPVELLVNTVKKALYTGNVGDGKIFIYEVDRVIKVRTSQEGKDALE
ncbi:MAG: P-II family nitrogen regulator [Huintestinicola sp.]